MDARDRASPTLIERKLGQRSAFPAADPADVGDFDGSKPAAVA